MQRSRRRDPIPWTWEIPLAIVLAIVVVLALGMQLGRSIANLLSGAGLEWAPRENLFRSLPGIVRGDAASGLSTAHSAAGPHLLWACLIVTEVALLVAAGWGLKAVMDRWGPNRVRGMATRADAEKLLGRSRLREAASVIRPDLYGKDS